MASHYGEYFDELVTKYCLIENAHDVIHPERNDCDGVGGCEIMRVAVEVKHEIMDELDNWRKGGPL